MKESDHRHNSNVMDAGDRMLDSSPRVCHRPLQRSHHLQRIQLRPCSRKSEIGVVSGYQMHRSTINRSPFQGRLSQHAQASSSSRQIEAGYCKERSTANTIICLLHVALPMSAPCLIACAQTCSLLPPAQQAQACKSRQ